MVGLNELLGCPVTGAVLLQIFRFKAGILCNTSKHFRANLFFIVEGKHDIRPA